MSFKVGVNQNGWKPDTIYGGILWDGFASALIEKTDKRTVVEIAKSLLQIGEEFGNFKVLKAQSGKILIKTRLKAILSMLIEFY